MKALTKSERRVMHLICLGHANKSIALHSGCAIKTVEKHRNAIYYKWNVNSATALIRVALRSGQFSLTRFLNSKISENAHHEVPQNSERILTPV